MQLSVRASNVHFHPPTDPTIPLVMVAAGSGLAPMRGFLQERAMQKLAGREVARNLLFFGCRSPQADSFFAAEWARTPGLDVVHAFSRDAAEKVYVQDAIRAQTRLVADLVRQNAVVCLCGGSSRMAEACRNAVRDALVQEGVAVSVDEARQMVAKLDWWQEIWS